MHFFGIKYWAFKMPISLNAIRGNINAIFRCLKCQNYFMKLEFGNIGVHEIDSDSYYLNTGHSINGTI